MGGPKRGPGKDEGENQRVDMHSEGWRERGRRVDYSLGPSALYKSSGGNKKLIDRDGTQQ